MPRRRSSHFARYGLLAAVLGVVLVGAGLLSGPAGAAATAGAGQARGYVTPRTSVAGSALTLPAGTRQGTLGALYTAARGGLLLGRVVLDTQHHVVFYQEATATYVASFVTGEASSIAGELLHDHVNLDVATLDPTHHASGGHMGYVVWNVTLELLLLLILLAVMVLVRRRARADAREHERRGQSSVAGVSAIPATRFSDIAGASEAVEDLGEFVDFLRSPERFTALGATMPKGALLVGPPGTGKTLLARAVAGEAGVPFFAVSGSEFAEVYVGMGPKRVRELFKKARAAAPSIIFIDEIDAVAKRRSSRSNEGSSEHDNTLNQLLVEMDGFSHSHVLVLAATNRPDVLDPALTRPGRLDRTIDVPNPDRRAREQILTLHCTGKRIAGDVDLEHLARGTSGMSGADLAQVVNEACLEAVRDEAEEVSPAHFERALARVAMGRARTSAVVTSRDRAITAWHEAGHTVCAFVLAAADKPRGVSILPRGHAGGVTWMAEGDDQFVTRSKAQARLATALGGRAGEELLLGEDITQGACGDLETATTLATTMATRYAMTDLGLMVRDATRARGEDAAQLTRVVEGLLHDALVEARATLVAQRVFFDALVAALLEHETLNAEEIAAVYHASQGLGSALERRTAPRPVPVRTGRAMRPRTVVEPVRGPVTPPPRRRTLVGALVAWRRTRQREKAEA